MWDIYPISIDINILLQILNWIGRVVYGDDPNSVTLSSTIKFIMGMAVLVGFLALMAKAAFSGGYRSGVRGGVTVGDYIKFMVIVMVVGGMLFAYPVKCRLHDLILEEYHGPPRYIDTNNVPLGIALPLFLTTYFEYSMVRLLDDTYSTGVIASATGTPSNYLYLSRGGGIGYMGNALLSLESASAQDPRLVVNSSTFVKECLVPAVALKVVSVSALANADSMLEVIKNNLLLNYYAPYEEPAGTIPAYSYLSCRDFYITKLEPDMIASSTNLQNSFLRSGMFWEGGILTTGMDVAESVLRAAFNNSLLSGPDIVTNAWFGRMVDMGIGESMGFENGTIQIMAEKMRDFKAKRGTFGILALAWLPRIKGILTIIMCAIWLPLLPFVFINHAKVLIGWVGFLGWLIWWGVILSVINIIYTKELIDVINATALTISGEHSLTFGNRWAVWEASTSTLAGMGMAVSWVIPLSGIIMGWITQKGGFGGGQSGAVESQINQAGDSRTTATIGGAMDLHSANLKTMAMRPDTMSNEAMYGVGSALSHAALADIYGPNTMAFGTTQKYAGELGGTLGANDPESGGPLAGGLGQNMREQTELYNASIDNAVAKAMMTRFQGLSGTLGKTGSATLSEVQNFGAAMRSMDSEAYSAAQAFRSETGVDFSEAERYARTRGWSAGWITDEQKREQVAAHLGDKSTRSSDETYGDGYQTSHSNAWETSIRTGADVDLGSVSKFGNIPQNGGGKFGKFGVDLFKASAGSSERDSKDRRLSHGRSERGSEAVDSSIQRDTSIGNSDIANFGHKTSGDFGQNASISNRKARVRSALENHQNELRRASELSRSASEARAIQQSFTHAVSQNAIPKLFGWAAKTGALGSGVNEYNVGDPDKLGNALHQFRDLMNDMHGRSALMNDYLTEKVGIAPETAQKTTTVNDSGIADNVRSLNVADGIRTADGRFVNGNAFELVNNRGQEVLSGLTGIQDRLSQAGARASQAIGMAGLWQNINEKVSNISSSGNGNGSPDLASEIRDSLTDKANGMLDVQAAQIGAASLLMRAMDRATDPNLLGSENAREGGTWDQKLVNGAERVAGGVIGFYAHALGGLMGAIESEAEKTGNGLFSPNGDPAYRAAYENIASMRETLEQYGTKSQSGADKLSLLQEKMRAFNSTGIGNGEDMDLLAEDMNIINDALSGQNNETINDVLDVGYDAMNRQYRDMGEYIRENSMNISVGNERMNLFDVHTGPIQENMGPDSPLTLYDPRN